MSQTWKSDPILSAIVGEIQSKYNCHTILLYGSRARGDFTEASDYDILAVRESGPEIRDARLWQGVYLDIFVSPESALLEPHPGMLDMRFGQVLCQKEKIADAFFTRLEKIFQAGPEKLRADEIQALLTWHEKALARIRAGGIQGNLRRAELIPALLEHLFTTRGIWYRGPKASFLWLRENHEELYRAFERALEPNASMATIEKLVALANAEIRQNANPAALATPPKPTSAPPQLRTQRLEIRMAGNVDIPALLQFYRENATHFAATDPPRPESFYTEEYWIDALAKARKAWAEEQGLRMYLFPVGGSEIVGSISLTQMARGPFHACYLGYGLAAKLEGQGYMAEALEATIRFLFQDLNFHRIMANHLPENSRSANVLRRLGFVVEGRAEEYLFINGRWRAHTLNALTNPAWKQHGA